MSTLTTAMVWGGSLAKLVSKADTLAQEVLDRNEVECNGRKVIIFIAWSGNDVFGEGGYVGCRWIHQARFLKTEADRKVAADWPLNQKARVQTAINALPALKNRPGVWDLVLVGNADAADYNLVDQYTREMTAWYYEAFHLHRIMSLDPTCMNIAARRYDGVHMDDSDASKTAASAWWTAAIGYHHSYLRYLDAKPGMEPLAVLPEGDALFNEEITKDLFAYPTISEGRHKLNGMLAGRPAESPPTTQEQSDVIDGCDAEIALWVQETLEEAADMAADDLVGDRLSEKQAALNPPELFDESDEETERINNIRKADKEEALADGADDTVDDEWNSVLEPEMMDFGLWTKVNAPGVNVDKVEPAPPTEREKAEEIDIDDITTVKTSEIEEFLGMSLDDTKDKKDDDEEMPDYGADDDVEVIDDDGGEALSG